MRIRKRSDRDSWLLDCGLLHGRRVQLTYKSRAEAEAEKKRREKLLRDEGKAAFQLSSAEQAACLRAIEQLREVGASLDDAVRYYLLSAPQVQRGMTLMQLADAWEEAKADRGKEGRWQRNLKSRVQDLARAVGENLPATQLTKQHVLTWLNGNGWQTKTWNNYLGGISAVLRWAVDEEHLLHNVCAKVKPKAEQVSEEVRFFTVQQAAELLRRTNTEEYRWALPSVVLGLFCGLRPEKEVGLMTWEHIQWSERVVIVTAGRSKTRQRRVVDLPEVAMQWLRLCTPEAMRGTRAGELLARSGKVVPGRWRRRFAEWRQGIGYYGAEQWPHDVLRHTYATYHLAHHGDEERLQLLMGHRSSRMLYQHYRGLATRAAAAEFWQLSPEEIDSKGRG
jgi:integrase